jgi:hypothetical protein
MRRAALGFLTGLALIVFGLWLAWPPLAPIGAGAALVTVSLLAKVGEPE